MRKRKSRQRAVQSRECLAAISNTSISGVRVTRELTRLVDCPGPPCPPETIAHNHRTRFTSNAVLAWTKDQGVTSHSIARGTPVQNGYIELFKWKMRDELLNEGVFLGLIHARKAIAAWVVDYDTAQPHSSLICQTPAAFAG